MTPLAHSNLGTCPGGQGNCRRRDRLPQGHRTQAQLCRRGPTTLGNALKEQEEAGGGGSRPPKAIERKPDFAECISRRPAPFAKRDMDGYVFREAIRLFEPHFPEYV